MDSIFIDTFEFCRIKDSRQGEIAVKELPRLLEQVASSSGLIRWVLRGENDKLGHPCLKLSVSGSLQLVCQRCLVSFGFDVLSVSTLVLAKSEAEADEIDALLADDGIDVVVGSESFNLTELIEDEVMLALPIAPKHEICPEQDEESAAQLSKKPSPFAVLKNLK